MDTKIEYVATLPDQTGTWDEEKYKLCLRYFAGLWNPMVYGVGLGINGGNVNSVQVDDTRYVPFYIRNASYITGTQSNADYAFFTLDLRGNQTSVPMFRGLEVKKYFDYFHGYVSSMIEQLPKFVNVSAYSQNAISARKETMNATKFAVQSKSILNIIQNATGYGFKPIDKDFESMEQVDKYFETFQEAMEVAYHNIAKDSIYLNNYMSTIMKCVDASFIGGRGIMEVYWHKGKPYWHPVDPVCAIYDMSKNDDQHRHDDYGGEIKMYPYTYVIDRWGKELSKRYGEKVIKDIEKVAKSGQNGWQNYNTLIGYNGLYWFNNINGVPHIGVLRMQWRSLKKDDDDYSECLREGTLIGNQWLCEDDESEGQVYDVKNPSKKRLRYIMFSPSTMLGTNLGLGGMIVRFADLCDALITKMTGSIAKSFGRVGFIRASKLPTYMTTPDVVSQLKQDGIIVIDDADMDEEDSDKSTKLAEGLDLTLDPGLQQILMVLGYLENKISDMINIPSNIRGIPTTNVYQSEKTTEQNVQQATLGMEYYYSNIRQFIENLVSYTANLGKLMYPETNEEHLRLMVGDANTELMSMEVFKKMQFEDFMLRLNFNNAIDETQRANYRELIMNFAQQGSTLYKLSTLVKIDTFETKSEVGDYIEAIEKKFEMQQEAIRQQELEAQMAQSEMANQTQENMANTNAEAGLEKTDRTIQGKLLSDLIKSQASQPVQQA